MVYLMKNCNFFLPRTFIWADPTNHKGVKDYIDTLISRDFFEAKKFEEAGMVSDAVFHDPPEDVRVIRISADRLRTVLRGEDPLEVPADSQLVWSDPSCGYIPQHIMAEIVSEEMEHIQRQYIEDKIAQGRPVMYKNTPVRHIPKLQDEPEKNHFGINMTGEEESPSAELPPAPTSEQPISTQKYERHTDIITLVVGGHRAYFVRRLVSGANQLWCGTAYSPDGRWTEYYRDQARLTALGVNPP